MENSDNSLKDLNDLSELLSSNQSNRKPVRVTISLDEGVYNDLKDKAGSLSFSRAVEMILRRVLKRGAA